MCFNSKMKLLSVEVSWLHDDYYITNVNHWRELRNKLCYFIWHKTVPQISCELQM